MGENYLQDDNDLIPNTSKLQNAKPGNSSGLFTQRNFSELGNAKLSPSETNWANRLPVHFGQEASFALEAEKSLDGSQPQDWWLLIWKTPHQVLE